MRKMLKTSYFENLHDTLADIPSTEQIYLMGDFNGKVGNERHMYTDYLGPHGRGTRNDNGESENVSTDHRMVVATIRKKPEETE